MFIVHKEIINCYIYIFIIYKINLLYIHDDSKNINLYYNINCIQWNINFLIYIYIYIYIYIINTL